MTMKKQVLLSFIFPVLLCANATLASEPDSYYSQIAPDVLKAVTSWFTVENSGQQEIPEGLAKFKDLSRGQAIDISGAVWVAYQRSPLAKSLLESLPGPVILKDGDDPQQQKHELKTGDKIMPFVFIGKGKLDGQRPMFIALHGGGSAGGRAPSPHGWSVNTREWAAQSRLAATVYPNDSLYFVPRMADDNDGRWYYHYCQDAYDKVVRAAILHHNVNPNRVYLIGISEGAYTAYRMGAFMADRWAGAGSMAGGEPLNNAPPLNMRNIAFRADIGENDKMYDRVGLNRRYGQALAKLMENDPEGYVHAINVQAGRGHGINYKPCPEWLFQHERNPHPKRVNWKVIKVHSRYKKQFYWLALDDEPSTWPIYIDARIDKDNQTVNVTVEKDGKDGKRVRTNETALRIYLNDEMLDLDKSVRVVRNGKEVFSGTVDRNAGVMAKTLAQRGDFNYMFPSQVLIDSESDTKELEDQLIKHFPPNRQRFVGWMLRRAADNREKIIRAILAAKDEYKPVSLSVLSQLSQEDIETLDRPALTEQINSLGAILIRVPDDKRRSFAGALKKAAQNRDEIKKLMRDVKDEHINSAIFLISNMPSHDLQSLKSDFLVDQIKLAHKAWEKSPWHDEIPEQIFQQYILPYSNLNERRDNWRADFMKRLSEKAWSFDSPMDATIWLNTDLNDIFKVYFHATKRPKADQSPFESIEAGFASCTGLSILLADCCRSVGIPARLVGVPLWTEVRGNHNWVEVWDGQWHNVGGTGSDPRNDDWVNKRCETQTDPDQWMHAVYAACFKKTSLHFPMVWKMDLKYVSAHNVTRFYSSRKEVTIDIPDGKDGIVEVSWAGEIIARKSGKEKVSFMLAKGSQYQVNITTADGKVHQQKIKL